MKIYTYHENINFKAQNPLVDTWKKSWESQGFEAIVLGRADAEKHDFYGEFVSRLEKLHLDIIEKPIQPYGMSCYLRWLAYANTLDSNSFVSDYDVINVKLPSNQSLPDRLMFYDNCCPCFASGTSKLFMQFCFDILNISERNLIDLKNKKIEPWYHDQEFIVHNENEFKNLDYVTMDNRDPIQRLIQQYEHKNPFIENNSKVIHFSHGSIGHAKENFPELKDENSDELRVSLINDALK